MSRNETPQLTLRWDPGHSFSLLQESFDSFTGVGWPLDGTGLGGHYFCWDVANWAAKTDTSDEWKCFVGNLQGDGYSYIWNSNRFTSSSPFCGAEPAGCCKSAVPATLTTTSHSNSKCLPAGFTAHASDALVMYRGANHGGAVSLEQCEAGLRAAWAYAEYIGDSNKVQAAEYRQCRIPLLCLVHISLLDGSDTAPSGRASDQTCWWIKSTTEYVAHTNQGTTCMTVDTSTVAATPPPAPPPAQMLVADNAQCEAHMRGLEYISGPLGNGSSTTITAHDSSKVQTDCPGRCSECAKPAERFHLPNGVQATEHQTCTKCKNISVIIAGDHLGFDANAHDVDTLRARFAPYDHATGQGSCEVLRWSTARSEYPGKAKCAAQHTPQSTEWMQCIDSEFMRNTCSVQNLQTPATSTTFFTQTKLCSSRQLLVPRDDPDDQYKGVEDYAIAYCEVNKVVSFAPHLAFMAFMTVDTSVFLRPKDLRLPRRQQMATSLLVLGGLTREPNMEAQVLSGRMSPTTRSAQ